MPQQNWGKTDMVKILWKVMILTLVALTLVMVESVSAQSIPTPSVPEFSIRYVDNSYYVSIPTTITDQYGNSRVVQGSFENKTVEFSIKNQPFTPYTIPYNSNDPYNTGQTVGLMYNIRMKTHSNGDWQYITHLSDGYLKQSDTNFTIASYQLEELFPMGIPSGKIDFQVQALIGYVHRYPIVNSWTLNGTQSDWSSAQTITMPESSLSNSISADLAVPLAWIGGGVILVGISLFFLQRKQKQRFH